MTTERTIRVEALTRVEGEGGLHVSLDGDRVERVQLSIYEPPRFFEGFLRGRALEEVPDITARICGICPVAYQMTAVHALELALGVRIPEEIRRLRRLLYCGEWIESHGLHMHLLQAPDFFGCASGIELAQKYPQEVSRGLRLKKHGNQLLEVLGGRAIHPVNVAVGGFHRAPSRQDLQRLIPDFEWGLEASIATTKWVASFDYPDFPCCWEMISLKHPDEYPMNEGTIASSSGRSVPVQGYEEEFEEQHVAHSTALHSVRRETQSTYYVGPLARVSLAFDQLSPLARKTAEEIGFEIPCHNPFQAIIARGLELIHAFEEGLELLKTYQPWSPARCAYDYREAEGWAATEAPRGLIYHRYKVGADGKVQFAKIVPPTSQNQRQIEADLKEWIPRVMNPDEQKMADDCERLIRTYDPCISCSTHFLRLTIQNGSSPSESGRA